MSWVQLSSCLKMLWHTGEARDVKLHAMFFSEWADIYRYSDRYRDRDRYMSIDRAVLAAFRSMSNLAELCSHTSVSDYTGKSTLLLKFSSIGTDIKQLQVSCVLTSFF